VAVRAKSGLHLAALLLGAERWIDAAVRSVLHARGWPQLTRAHSLVFAHLDRQGTRPAEIARRAGVTRQAIGQTIAELSRLGLVEQVPDPTNRRACLVVLTDDGRRADAAAVRAFRELERELARRIGSERVRALRDALEADWGSPNAR
jgi:DNA-binding MarR family transcriptional regulator